MKKKINVSEPLLINCMEAYLLYLNENMPVHQHEIRNRAYVNSVDRYFRYYLEALKLHNVDVTKLKFTDVDSELNEQVFNYLKGVRKFRRCTCNKIRRYLSRFNNYAKAVYNLNVEGNVNE